MIWHTQIFLCHNAHPFHDTLKPSFDPFFDLTFSTPFHSDQEIWIVLDCRLERRASVLGLNLVGNEIKVNRCSSTGNGFVGNYGAVHVAEPANSFLSSVVTRET